MHIEVQADRSSDIAVDENRHSERPKENPVLTQWPFVERRRRTTDRRAPAPLPTPDVSHLCTVREQQIITLLLQGMSNKKIGQQLGIVEDTVKKHLQHIYDKLGIHRRTLVMLGVAVKPAEGDSNALRRELTG
jgi:DNA-binding NarL/FixJ family response regulator